MPRLYLDEDLTECVARGRDDAFEAGHLLGPGDNDDVQQQRGFDVSVVEMWGAGGDSARAALGKANRAAESLRAKAGRVDRAKMAETSFDREHLFGEAFKCVLRPPPRPHGSGGWDAARAAPIWKHPIASNVAGNPRQPIAAEPSAAHGATAVPCFLIRKSPGAVGGGSDAG